MPLNRETCVPANRISPFETSDSWPATNWSKSVKKQKHFMEVRFFFTLLFLLSFVYHSATATVALFENVDFSFRLFWKFTFANLNFEFQKLIIITNFRNQFLSVILWNMGTVLLVFYDCLLTQFYLNLTDVFS